MEAQPKIQEYASLSFSPAAANALETTNTLASQLRSLPPHLADEQLRNDRALVLNISLPRLLKAHMDARHAGDVTADRDLVSGLKHIREELQRILEACQSRARDALATQGNYLEQRYPAHDSFNPEPALSAAKESPSANRSLPLTSLENLFKGDVTVPEENQKTKFSHQRNSIWWPGFAIAGLCASVLFSLEVSNMTVTDTVLNSPHVDITPVIDSVRRTKIIRSDGDKKWEDPMVVVDLHGTVKNRDKDELESSIMAVELLNCPYADSAVDECSVNGIGFTNVVASGGLKPNANARWKDHLEMSQPVNPHFLRVRVTPERSTFKRS